MKIQEFFTITELSRLLNKSRPSVYKYLSDYGVGNFENIPPVIKELFDKVENEGYNKSNVYDYCYKYLIMDEQKEIKEIYELLNENKDKLNLAKIKQYIMEEITNGK